MVVLVAEDDDAIFDVINIILGGEGYLIIRAIDDASISAAVQKQQPNVILLDISLGASNGGEVTEKLKNNPDTKTIPIIMMSAHTETEVIAKRTGADGFLLKPFDINDLLSKVKEFST